MLPAWKPMVKLFEKSERKPLAARMDNKNSQPFQVKVRSLNADDRPLPRPEHALLLNSKYTAGCNKDTPVYPAQWGKDCDKYVSDAWYSGVRTAGLVSTAGILTNYLKI